jgi:hypothetical protein
MPLGRAESGTAEPVCAIKRASGTRNGPAFTKENPSDQGPRDVQMDESAGPAGQACATIEVRSNTGGTLGECCSPLRSNSIRRSKAVDRIIG